ncbi:hypothetical protein GCM10023152_35680 [Agromyces bauzanensis]|uniref:Uncharacterized protein n=1 Tax=Agromyces bauzanensis TaxID=1308924 RepID=A0A917PK05_9MICO|nr:hypothetical protein GCM10011372_20920 [Agromyces bauzanensis]
MLVEAGPPAETTGSIDGRHGEPHLGLLAGLERDSSVADEPLHRRHDRRHRVVQVGLRESPLRRRP